MSLASCSQRDQGWSNTRAYVDREPNATIGSSVGMWKRERQPMTTQAYTPARAFSQAEPGATDGVSQPLRQRILVVDDEPSIVDAVATSLRYEGFEVAEATTGRSALLLAEKDPPDLMILDIMLPDLDGMEVTRRMRSSGIKVPVLFLTAKDSVEDKVTGLSIGADDYVTKPFSLAEVVARTRVILRRVSESQAPSPKLTFADLVLDEDTHQVWRGSNLVPLTATEFNVLRYFLLNPRRVLSKSQILDNVWHYDFGGNANVVETYVSYLRKKLDELGPPLIHTIRMVGYILRDPE